VDLYHKFIKYVYISYFQNLNIENKHKISKEEQSQFKDIINTLGTVCDIELKQTIPIKEIYIRLELHSQKIDDTNVDDFKCYYFGEELGDKLQKMILGIQPTSYFVKDEGNALSSTNQLRGENYTRNIDNPKKNIQNKDSKTFTAGEIEKANQVYLENNNKSVGKDKKPVREMIPSYLDKIEKFAYNVQDPKYTNIKTLEFDEQTVISNIMNNKFIPIDEDSFNHDLGSMLLQLHNADNDSVKFERDGGKKKLLYDIDDYIRRLKSKMVGINLDINDVRREGDATLENDIHTYNYLDKVYKLYEFITIYTIYATLSRKLYKELDGTLYQRTDIDKGKTGGKRITRQTKTRKYHKKYNKKRKYTRRR
jgi:hypothetical protein